MKDSLARLRRSAAVSVTLAASLAAGPAAAREGSALVEAMLAEAMGLTAEQRVLAWEVTQLCQLPPGGPITVIDPRLGRLADTCRETVRRSRTRFEEAAALRAAIGHIASLAAMARSDIAVGGVYRFMGQETVAVEDHVRGTLERLGEQTSRLRLVLSETERAGPSRPRP